MDAALACMLMVAVAPGGAVLLPLRVEGAVPSLAVRRLLGCNPGSARSRVLLRSTYETRQDNRWGRSLTCTILVMPIYRQGLLSQAL